MAFGLSGVLGSEFGEWAKRQMGAYEGLTGEKLGAEFFGLPIVALYSLITDTPVRDIPIRRQVDTPIRLHVRSSALGLASVTAFP